MNVKEIDSWDTRWQERPNQQAQARSDTLRRYGAIRDAGRPGYPGQPTGIVARRWTTLAALLNGIVGSKSPQRPSVATTIPEGTQPESRGKRLTRWRDNVRIVEEVSCVPYGDSLRRQGALATLEMVMEGRVVGRGGLAWRRHVVSKGRALPRAWRVRHSPTGPWPEACHIAMVEWVRPGIPAGTTGVCLGDGAGDGSALQAPLSARGGASVCRTALRTTAAWQGEPWRLAV